MKIQRPKKDKKKINAAKSMRILEDALPDTWDVRRIEQTQDYGIDCDIDIVDQNGWVLGRFFKAQVKSKAGVKFNKKGTVKVGGIKESTLLHWIDLSETVPVIAFLIDTVLKKVYFTSASTQAKHSWKGDGKKKSITFNQKADLSDKNGNFLFVLYACLHDERRQREAHKFFLTNIYRYLADYCSVDGYDKWCINYDRGSFEQFLKHARHLCWLSRLEIFDISYWIDESEKRHNDHIFNDVMVEAYEKILPLVLESMRSVSESVIKSSTYWGHFDSDYLDQNQKSKLPTFVKMNSKEVYSWLTTENILIEPYC